MENKENNIQVVVLMTAEGPVVGSLVGANELEILLSNPVLITSDGEGLQMIPYMSWMVDLSTPITFSRYGFSSMAKPNPQLEKEYMAMFDVEKPQIFVPDNKIII